MINKSWRETEHHSELYYREDDGLIVGHVHRLGTQNIIWIAKGYKPEDYSEAMLGHYISRDYARKAVERFWEVQERTLLEDTKYE